MATSTFTRKIVLSDEAVDILAADLAKDEGIERPVVTGYEMADEEFLKKCLEQWNCKK